MIAQLGLPVGVRQAAHIEHQVGVDWHAALEAKGFDEERGAGFRLVQQAQFDGVAQLIEVEAGGVQLKVGEVGDRSEQLALVANRLRQRTGVGGQRVAPAGFRESFEQRLVVGVEIQHIAVDVVVPHFLQQFGEALQLAGQVAGVDRHRHLWLQ